MSASILNDSAPACRWRYATMLVVHTRHRGWPESITSGDRAEGRSGFMAEAVLRPDRADPPWASSSQRSTVLQSGRLSLAELDRLVLPRKTLSHRRKIGHLTPEQSDRLVRVVQVDRRSRGTPSARLRRLLVAAALRREPSRVTSLFRFSTRARGREKSRTSCTGSITAWRLDHRLADLPKAFC